MSRVISPADFGAKPWPEDSTDAFEQALANAGARAEPTRFAFGVPPGAVVAVPAETYMVTRPLFVPDGVDVVGPGWAGQLVMEAMRRYPLLTYGVDDPRVLPVDRPDAFGKLDASAAPSPGVRRGFSTAGGLFLQAQHTALNAGRFGAATALRDYWAATPGLTLDVAVELPEGLPPAVPLFGIGESCAASQPRPYTLSTHPARPGWVLFSVADDRAAGEADLATRGYVFPVPAGFRRLVIQHEPATGRFGVACDGVWSEFLEDGTPGRGRAYRRNEDWPWVLGRCGYKPMGGPPTPLSLHGYRVHAGPRYAWGAPGTPVVRSDGTPPPDDRWRYFSADDQKATVGYIEFLDPISSRYLTFVDGDSLREAVLVMRPAQGGGAPNRLASIALSSNGAAVQLGAVLKFRARDVFARGVAGPAVGSVPMIMSYPVELDGCHLESHDACYQGSCQIASLRHTYFEGQGTHSVRVRGSSIALDSAFLAFSHPEARSFLVAYPGGEGTSRVVARDVVLDTERGGYRECILEVHQQPQHAVTLDVDRLEAAWTAVDEDRVVPVVRLRSTPGSTAPARAVVRGVVTKACHRVVRCDYPGWSWSVDCPDARATAGDGPAPSRP